MILYLLIIENTYYRKNGKQHMTIKKSIMFAGMLFTSVLISCPAGTHAHAAHIPDKKPAPEKQQEKSGWISYSNGLYYKNRALENIKSARSSDDLKKALKLFKTSLKDKVEKDRIYYQISDCYYYLYDYSKSLEYAYKSIAENNKNLDSYNRIYNIFMRLRNYTKAAEILNDYLKADPDYIYIHHLLAEHYLTYMKDTNRAVKAYNKVLSLSGKDAVEDYYKENALYKLGYIFYQKGDDENAIKHLKKNLEINRNNDKAHYLLAVIYMNSYRLDNALDHSKSFLINNPDNAKINAIAGRVYYIRNKTDAGKFFKKSGMSKSIDGIISKALYNEIIKKDKKAEEILSSAVKFKPSMIEIHKALGNINERKNNSDAAFNEFLTAGILLYQQKLYIESAYELQKALKLKNDVAGIYYYLGRTYEDSNSISRAILHYKKTYEIKPSIDLMLHIGYLYGLRGDYDTAIDNFVRASEMEPENSKPHFFSGLISIWQSNYSEAEVYINKAISLTDNNETYYFYYAIVMEKLHKFDKAVSSLELAIKYNPKSARAYNYLGYLYADKGIHIEESYSLIRKALELEPENGAYIDSLGWVYYQKKDYNNALKNLLHAQQILEKNDSPDPVVFDHIGDTYEKLGDIDNAVRYWNKSLNYDKKDSIQKKIDRYNKKSR